MVKQIPHKQYGHVLPLEIKILSLVLPILGPLGNSMSISINFVGSKVPNIRTVAQIATDDIHWLQVVGLFVWVCQDCVRDKHIFFPRRYPHLGLWREV